MVVHHSGKDDSKGARGHSSIIGASDAIYEVSKSGDAHMLRVTKLKEGESGKKFGFKIVPVTLRLDEDGDNVESCFVEYCEVLPMSKKMGDSQRRVYEVLLEVTEGSWTTESNLYDNYIDKFPPKEGETKVRKGNLTRTLKSMSEHVEQNENGEYRALR